MKQMIVNGDNWGLTEWVARAILDAHCYGIVANIRPMPNVGAFETSSSRSTMVPWLGIGPHLNLIRRTPVTVASRAPSLVVNADGHRLGRMAFGRAVLFRQVGIGDAERELGAQIEKSPVGGIDRVNLDGHRDLRGPAAILDLVVEQTPEYGLLSARGPVVTVPSPQPHVRADGARWHGNLKLCPLGRGLARSATADRWELRRARLISPTCFYGLTQTGLQDGSAPPGILRRLPEATSGLMRHPGPALRATPGRLPDQRQVEFSALMESLARKIVREQGIELNACADLQRARDQTYRKFRLEMPFTQKAVGGN